MTLNETLSEIVEKGKDQLLEIIKETPDIDNFTQANDIWVSDGDDKKLLDKFLEKSEKDIEKLYLEQVNDIEKAYKNNSKGEGSEKNHKQIAIWYYLREEMLKDLEHWCDDIFQLIDEHRQELEEELKSLEFQHDNALDAEDEDDLIDILQAEVDAFDIDEKMDEFLEELDKNSV